MGYRPKEVVHKYQHHADWLLSKAGHGPQHPQEAMIAAPGISKRQWRVKPFRGKISPHSEINFSRSDLLVKQRGMLPITPLHRLNLTPKQKILVSKQVGRVVAFLHKNGIVHGDARPYNFFVGMKNGKPKVYFLDNATATLEGLNHSTTFIPSKEPRFDKIGLHPASFEKEKEALLDPKIAIYLDTNIIKEQYEKEMETPWYMFRKKKVLNPKIRIRP